MPTLAVISTGGLAAIVIGALVIWTVTAAMVTLHARDRGFPSIPIFICALFLGFPLVLLAVTVAGPREG